uniref:Ycf54 n=1 Tax=Wrangelia sp. TaxID=2575620 RepID=A0A4D6X2E6_9FLOR|nr:hypothetical protein [Wrangelia sp.]
MYNYYFVLASENFLLNEEPLEEILRERFSHYKTFNKDIDFWLVRKPNFIDIADIENFTQKIDHSYAAIVSLDQKFIQWLKLRIGFVVLGSFKSNSLFISNS